MTISVVTADTSSVATALVDTPVATPRTGRIAKAAGKRRRRIPDTEEEESESNVFQRWCLSSIETNDDKMRLRKLKYQKLSLEIAKLERERDMQ